ncbi:MAG TPA: hypothetical protein DDX98_08880 [Bacteroidales bacterium]|nr:hypothetical protein [Bacteroidales bacterium]
MSSSANIKARTYNLYSNEISSDAYYKKLEKLSNLAIELYDDPNKLISDLRRLSNRKRKLKRIIEYKRQNTSEEKLVLLLREHLDDYLLDVDGYIKQKSLIKLTDKKLGISREQYVLYMLEAELTNRINRKEFNAAKGKVAMLPHCLKDLNESCQASIEGFDYVCRLCKKDCHIYPIVKVLRQHQIESFLWTGNSFKSLIQESRNKGQTFGMLGIACIPELINGMRTCSKIPIPTVGFPLDGNCCRRWWGKTFQSTFNIGQLNKLLIINDEMAK